MAEGNHELSLQEDDSVAGELRLIRAIRDDPKAFGELYKVYVEKVFRYLYSRIGNVQEAEDVTAQTFLAAFETFDQYRQKGCFAAWLFSIARNKTADHFRRRKAIAPIEDAEQVPVNFDPLQGMIRSEQIADLTGLIRALAEDDQELLRLRFLAGMSFQAIAQLLQRNEDAVKKSLYRLLARLQSQVEVSYE
jgi:RNA polymerase sigma-70 factor, ECF subfamily